MVELTLAKARELLDAAIAAATEIGLPISATVVDAGGHVVAKIRMDGANLISGQVSEDKAYTAAVIGMTTGDLQPMVQPGAPLYGLLGREGQRLVTLGGGFALRVSERVVGGFGVSGGTVEQDVEVAQSALRVWGNV